MASETKSKKVSPFKSKKLLAVTKITLFVAIAVFVSSYWWYAPTTKLVDGVRAVQQLPDDIRDIHMYVGEGAMGYKVWGIGLSSLEIEDAAIPHGARSPNGFLLVQARRQNPDVPTQALGAAVNPREWGVYVRNLETGEASMLAYGYAPAFLDDTHIGYFTEAGFAVIDVTSKKATLLFRFPQGTKLHSMVQYSPNRSRVFWSDVNKNETIVAEVGPATVRPLHTYTNITNPVLTDTSLYTTKHTSSGLEVTRHAFSGESAPTMVFPQSLGIKFLAF